MRPGSNAASRQGQTAEARSLKGARFAPWKNPEDLTGRQQATLAQIAQTNEPLYRAYLLKEQLRQVLKLPAAEALALLERWLAWARRLRPDRSKHRCEPRKRHKTPIFSADHSVSRPNNS